MRGEGAGYERGVQWKLQAAIFAPEAAAWDEADSAECRGEVGRNWVFGEIVHLLPIPLDFSVL